MAQASAPGEWTIIERGPHHQVHERIELLDLGGGRVERIPHRHVELASGMHYWDNGQWKESKAQFTVLPSGYPAG